MSNIKLNFINHSNDVNNSEVVIFQKNVATDFNELAVAWTVIKNCGVNDNHPFVYPSDSSAAAEDSWGNYTPQMLANPGSRFEMVKDASGDVLVHSSQPASNPKEIEIANNLVTGAINARIYKSGKLLASKTQLSPEEKATFEFKPTLFIGVASEIVEGEVMNSAIISEINTELSLEGIASADIVMTGGGTGQDATAFQFQLESIIYS